MSNQMWVFAIVENEVSLIVAQYLKAIWNVINFEEAGKRYAAAIS